MNSDQDEHGSGGLNPRKSAISKPTKSKLAAVVVAATLGIYSLAAPRINDRFGLDLPLLQAASEGHVEVDDPPRTPFDDHDDNLAALLREVSRDRYISPAGLMYTTGSAEGHRLEHLKRHTRDDPQRPGNHGVFDGDMANVIKMIDRAYELAKQGSRTTKTSDKGRTIYTVDMGGRIGYVGGREGNRKRKPMARRVRLVVEGNRVITAYPM